MTRRRGKATPKHLRSPPRPPNVEKMIADIEKHHVGIATIERNFDILRQIALNDASFRQLYLDTFFCVHRSRYVKELVYDPGRERIDAAGAGPDDHLAVACVSDWWSRRQYAVFVDEHVFLQGYRAHVDLIAKEMYAVAREAIRRR